MENIDTPPSPKAETLKRWRVLNREYEIRPDHQQFSRRLNRITSEPISDWLPVATSDLDPSSPSPATEPKKLHLIRQDQAEGEPRHWSLFVVSGEDKSSKGHVWQVTGDALCMHYNNLSDTAQFAAEGFNSNYELNSNLSEAQERMVEEAVKDELPPAADDERSIKENCQGWTIRVLRRLQGQGVVAERTADWIERDLLEPLRERG
ncbi:hypothetical protein CONLIGDRAFT_462426 [Coniochaeta ligniaria NRRL 30616]|uniref:Uncharacterized protein n=1 Tax=Coniochaeta ligniaria NRRL 30616 TaxID=1408157 RepID=A0A1J7ILE6_9PEZI|nr:hypothetical protein CONLIGDRAFT_462426 [Coniochaeta ligniaria NRRL 30616]